MRLGTINKSVQSLFKLFLPFNVYIMHVLYMLLLVATKPSIYQTGQENGVI